MWWLSGAGGRTQLYFNWKTGKFCCLEGWGECEGDTLLSLPQSHRWEPELYFDQPGVMWSVRLPDPGGGGNPSLGLVNMSYHSCRMLGVGERGRGRESWCRSWSPCPGRLRSLGAARLWGGAWRDGELQLARTRWAEAWSPASVPERAARSACCPRGRRGSHRRGSPPRGCEGGPGVRCCGREAVEACTSSPETEDTLIEAGTGQDRAGQGRTRGPNIILKAGQWEQEGFIWIKWLHADPFHPFVNLPSFW